MKTYPTNWKVDKGGAFDINELDRIVYQRVMQAHIDAMWQKVLMGDKDSKPVGVLPDNQSIIDITSSKE